MTNTYTIIAPTLDAATPAVEDIIAQIERQGEREYFLRTALRDANGVLTCTYQDFKSDKQLIFVIHAKG